MLKMICWPFLMIWRFVGFLLELCGRLVASILGFVLMMVGVLLTITVVGAIVGIPLIVTGGALAFRSLF